MSRAIHSLPADGSQCSHLRCGSGSVAVVETPCAAGKVEDAASVERRSARNVADHDHDHEYMVPDMVPDMVPNKLPDMVSNKVPDMVPDLSVVFPFFGRYERVEEGIFQRLEELEPLAQDFEFVFVLDGPFWKTLCLVQTIAQRFPQAKCVEIDRQTDLPAVLFNAGMRASRGRAVAFALANQACTATNYRRLAGAVRLGEPGQAFYLSSPEIRGRFSSLPTAGLLHGWQQYGPLLPLTAVAAPRTSNAFDESPLLQTACDWDWLVRLSKDVQVQHAGELVGTASAVPLRRYPFCRLFRPSDDLQHRYVVRSKQPTQYSGEGAAKSWCQESFLPDLTPDDSSYLQRRAEAFGSMLGPGGNEARRGHHVGHHVPMVMAGEAGPYKIAITGGDWEYHHNRLTFFNYLDYLQGSGFASYKVLLDRSVTRSDLAGNDLVVLTRARCGQVRSVIDHCAALGIPTLYMIDDNWLTVAADYPKYYARIFSPGRPDYENFLYALRHVTAVLTYSPILAEDIAPYAGDILRLPVSVPLAEFESVPRPVHADGFVVGYAGSLRHEDAAFAAMAAVARKRQDVRSCSSAISRRSSSGCSTVCMPHGSRQTPMTATSARSARRGRTSSWPRWGTSGWSTRSAPTSTWK